MNLRPGSFPRDYSMWLMPQPSRRSRHISRPLPQRGFATANSRRRSSKPGGGARRGR